MARRREIQRFALGDRVELAFAAGAPFLFRKSWGEFACSRLVSGKVAFFPVAIFRRIEALALEPGERIHITRSRGLFGSEWEIKRAALLPVAAPFTDQRVITDSHEPIRTNSAIATPQSERLLVNMYAVLNAVAVAESYAAGRGRTIQFSTEDIRALAISGFIEQSRGN